jgi:hypothetical protein
MANERRCPNCLCFTPARGVCVYCGAPPEPIEAWSVHELQEVG